MRSLVILVGTLLVLLMPATSHAQDTTGTSVPDTVLVQKVTSGTTFTGTDGTAYTLLGLAVPKSQAISSADAREHLADLIEGKTVLLATDTLAPADTKKKKHRYVYIGTTFVNLRMLQDGYAQTSKTPHSHADSFQKTLAEARSAQRGAYATERSSAVQCSGTTQRGTRCKRHTTNLNGRCWQHQ